MVITFGYVRISTDNQKAERQYRQIEEYRPNIKNRNIFNDTLSGKDSERVGYIALKAAIDATLNVIEDLNIDCCIELVVTELDRLGRSKKQLLEDILYFYNNGIILRVLNIPSSLIEITDSNKEEILKTNKTIFEVYAAMAETELELQKERQKVGIQIAKEEGKYKGRKPIELTNTVKNIIEKTFSNELSVTNAAKELNISRQTIYKLIDEYKQEKKEKEFEIELEKRYENKYS